MTIYGSFSQKFIVRRFHWKLSSPGILARKELYKTDSFISISWKRMINLRILNEWLLVVGIILKKVSISIRSYPSIKFHLHINNSAKLYVYKISFCAIRIRSKTLVEIECSHIVLSYVLSYDKVELIKS